ncbi:zinc-dependent alcohol dehydrogenase family protein [Halomonas binhaiensis]|uniref:Zinc-dependent alcohol dehydrogenase family protein n=1 Tax=Halomonas binhaiensis TaxID=2562282 RepID=A0A856QVQ9_9GAMM|nr:zinc-dependent alcohol dehydrogenase family protein [Halomonas binhaiensis]QEM84007.2 zinc-dependent alcohol dehydrogenase family protein [Halomonas binhaiensis]
MDQELASVENRALVYRAFGEPEKTLRLETFKTGPLQPGLVRVGMSMSPINPSDLIPVTGAYRHRVIPPLVAGYEGLGVVKEAPPTHTRLVGQRVLPLRGPGTWQDHVDCVPDWLISVPDDIPDHLAARAYINPLAALLMLKRWHPAGRSVMVTAAGSTCAGLLAQWALSLGATHVVGIYRSPRHIPDLQKHGIIPVNACHLAEVASWARAVDLVFDAVGGNLATILLGSMPKHAHLISYGLLSGMPFSHPMHGPSVTRFHIRDQFDGLQPSTWQAWFQEIWSLLRGSCLPEVERIPLENWHEALTLFQQSGRRFKPVLSFQYSE